MQTHSLLGKRSARGSDLPPGAPIVLAGVGGNVQTAGPNQESNDEPNQEPNKEPNGERSLARQLRAASLPVPPWGLRIVQRSRPEPITPLAPLLLQAHRSVTAAFSAALRPQAAAPTRAERALGLLRRHGFNPTSAQCLDGAARLWLCGEAAIAYVDTGRALVAAGPPLCAPEHFAQVTERFVSAARRRGRAAAFFGVQARFLSRVRLPALAIGETLYFRPDAWSESLRRHPSLRAQLRRAQRKGLHIEETSAVSPALERGLQALRERWVADKPLPPMAFLAGPARRDPRRFPDRTLLLAWRGTALVGFLTVTPLAARNGALLQEWVRAPDAPNGTIELLVDAALRSAARAGLGYATLGLSPLAGAVPVALRAARVLGRPLFDFAGLQAFKAKFAPQGSEQSWLAGSGASSPALLLECLRAFAGGSFLHFGRATLRKQLSAQKRQGRPLEATPQQALD